MYVLTVGILVVFHASIYKMALDVKKEILLVQLGYVESKVFYLIK